MSKALIALCVLVASAFVPMIGVTSSHAGTQVGIATFYWKPQKTAFGGQFNTQAMTAAHKSLPFGTVVRVTRLSTGRSVVVRINDRGPIVRGRIIDLSLKAATLLGMKSAGVTRVRVQVIGRGKKAKKAYASLSKSARKRSRKSKRKASLKSKSSNSKAKRAAAGKKARKKTKLAKRKTKKVGVASLKKKARKRKHKSVATKSVPKHRPEPFAETKYKAVAWAS